MIYNHMNTQSADTTDTRVLNNQQLTIARRSQQYEIPM